MSQDPGAYVKLGFVYFLMGEDGEQAASLRRLGRCTQSTYKSSL